MLIRALIVLLIVLNLGAASWWIAGSSRVQAASAAPADDRVPRLLLRSESIPAAVLQAAPTSVVDAAPAPGPGGGAANQAVGDATGQHCFSLGPFTDEAGARSAGLRLAGAASLARTRGVPARGASAYSVFLAPAPDRAQAQATAERIGAAGFDDFLVVNTGEQANAVALGRYGSLEGAQRRQAALQAAGFPAQVDAVGARSPVQWWLDVRAPRALTLQRAGALAGAAGSSELGCELLL